MDAVKPKSNFLRNAWYVAAWDTEVTRSLFVREILGEPVLMYRKEDGTPVAISDICPHRYAPLHMGKLIGDVVECAYHGLRFDCTGRCVLNPHPGGNAPPPPRSTIKQYPLIEKWGAIWIWMGHKTPDESLLPDFSWLDHPEEWRPVRDLTVVNAHYELIADNVLDLSHLPFLHPTGLGSAPKNIEGEVVQDVQKGKSFWCLRSSNNVEPSPDVLFMNPTLKEFKCDKTNHARWDAPGHIAILVTYVKHGTVDEHKTGLRIATMLTPMTASGDRTWQFWSVARNMQTESEDMDKFIRKAAAIGLEQEDTGMIEGQFEMMGRNPDIFSFPLVALPNDVTPTRVRRALRRMIEEEQRELEQLEAERRARSATAAVEHA